MRLELEFKDITAEQLQFNYNKGNWCKNVNIRKDNELGILYVACCNVSKFDAWGTKLCEATIDIYFFDDSAITFNHVNNIRCFGDVPTLDN